MEEEYLLEMLVGTMGAVLGERLIGVYEHGDFAEGDFRAGRSNLNLLVVVAEEPNEEFEQLLLQLMAAMTGILPQWDDHVEVEFISIDALEGFRNRPHTMLRITAEEGLQRLPVGERALLHLFAVRHHAVVLTGAAIDEIMPQITPDELRLSVKAHAGALPTRARVSFTAREQAYEVLTICRAWYSWQLGDQASKRAAAQYCLRELPSWAELIGWAHDWWFSGGSEDAAGRPQDVVAFADDIVGRINHA